MSMASGKALYKKKGASSGGEDDDYEAMHLDIKPAMFDPTSMKTAPALPAKQQNDDTIMNPAQEDYTDMAPDPNTQGTGEGEYAYTSHRQIPRHTGLSKPVTRSSSLGRGRGGQQQAMNKVGKAPKQATMPTQQRTGVKTRSRPMYVPPPSDSRPLVGGEELYEEYNQDGKRNSSGEAQMQDLYETYDKDRNASEGQDLYEEYVKDKDLSRAASMGNGDVAHGRGRGRHAGHQTRAQTASGLQKQTKPQSQLPSRQVKSNRPPARFTQPPPPKNAPPSTGEGKPASSHPPTRSQPPNLPQRQTVSQLQPVLPKRTASRPKIGAPPSLPSRSSRPLQQHQNPNPLPPQENLDYEDTVPDRDHDGMMDDLQDIETELQYAAANEGRLRVVKPRTTSRSALLQYDQLDTT